MDAFLVAREYLSPLERTVHNTEEETLRSALAERRKVPHGFRSSWDGRIVLDSVPFAERECLTVSHE